MEASWNIVKWLSLKTEKKEVTLNLQRRLGLVIIETSIAV